MKMPFTSEVTPVSLLLGKYCKSFCMLDILTINITRMIKHVSCSGKKKDYCWESITCHTYMYLTIIWQVCQLSCDELQRAQHTTCYPALHQIQHQMYKFHFLLTSTLVEHPPPTHPPTHNESPVHWRVFTCCVDASFLFILV